MWAEDGGWNNEHMGICFALGQVHTTQFFNSVTHWAVHSTRFSGVLGVSHKNTRRRRKRSHYAILSIRRRNCLHGQWSSTEIHKNRIIVSWAVHSCLIVLKKVCLKEVKLSTVFFGLYKSENIVILMLKNAPWIRKKNCTGLWLAIFWGKFLLKNLGSKKDLSFVRESSKTDSWAVATYFLRQSLIGN